MWGIMVQLPSDRFRLISAIECARGWCKYIQSVPAVSVLYNYYLRCLLARIIFVRTPYIIYQQPVLHYWMHLICISYKSAISYIYLISNGSSLCCASQSITFRISISRDLAAIIIIYSAVDCVCVCVITTRRWWFSNDYLLYVYERLISDYYSIWTNKTEMHTCAHTHICMQVTGASIYNFARDSRLTICELICAFSSKVRQLHNSNHNNHK